MLMKERTTSSNLSAEQFITQIKETHVIAQSNLTKVADNMKWFYDRHASESIKYSVGDKIFLNG